MKNIVLGLIIALGVICGVASHPAAATADVSFAGESELSCHVEDVQETVQDALYCDIDCFDHCIDLGIPFYKCSIICGC